MASPTLLRLLTLSVVITNQIVDGSSKSSLLKEQVLNNVTLVIIHEDANNTNDNIEEKGIKNYTNNFDQQHNTNAESNDNKSKHNYILKLKHKDNEYIYLDKQGQSDENIKSNETIDKDSNRNRITNDKTPQTNKVNEVKAINGKLVKVILPATDDTPKHKETKLETNEEGDTVKARVNDVKQVPRHKHIVRVRHRVTQDPPYTMLDLNVHKVTQKWDNKIDSNEAVSRDNDILNLKPGDIKNHGTYDAGQDDVYKLKGDDAVYKLKDDDAIYKLKDDDAIYKLKGDDAIYKLKGDDAVYKLKDTDNVYKLKGGDAVYKLKDDYEVVEVPVLKHNNRHDHRDKQHSLFDPISLDNEVYSVKHREELETVEVPVSEHVNRIKHRENKNHRLYDTISRENVYKLKHRDVGMPVAKHTNKKHHGNKKHRLFDSILRNKKLYKIKHRDELETIEFPDTKQLKKKHHNTNKNQDIFDPISLDNELYKYKHETYESYEKPLGDNIYKIKNRDDYHKNNNVYKLNHHDYLETVEVPVLKYIHKGKHGFHIPKLQNRNSYKNKHNENENTYEKGKHKHERKKHHKTKHDGNKATWRPVHHKFKQKGNKEREDIEGKHQGQGNVDTEEVWAATDEVDTQKLVNHGEKVLDSYEELLKRNDLLDNPSLPFYVSTTTKPMVDFKPKKRVKKQILNGQVPESRSTVKENMTTITLMDDLNTVLRDKQEQNHKIDINSTLDRLASSKILDLLTERVAGQMLKKLQTRLASKNVKTVGLRTEAEPETVEQIEILFKNDGDMVISREMKKDNGSAFYIDSKDVERKLYY